MLEYLGVCFVFYTGCLVFRVLRLLASGWPLTMPDDQPVRVARRSTHHSQQLLRRSSLKTFTTSAITPWRQAFSDTAALNVISRGP